MTETEQVDVFRDEMCECWADEEVPDEDSRLPWVDWPRPDEDEFIPLPPEEPDDTVESSLEEPLDGPSEDLLLPLLWPSFSDIFVCVCSLKTGITYCKYI